MVGIGYCEVKKCRNRTNKRFCREHRSPADREGLLLVGESRPLEDLWIGKFYKWLKG